MVVWWYGGMVVWWCGDVGNNNKWVRLVKDICIVL
jgi:hypothetical protein